MSPEIIQSYESGTDQAIDPFFMTLEEIDEQAASVQSELNTVVNPYTGEVVSPVKATCLNFIEEDLGEYAFFATLEEIEDDEKSSFSMTLEEIESERNPFKGENIPPSPFTFPARRETIPFRNPMTGKELAPIITRNESAQSIIEPTLDRSRAMKTFQQFYSQIESANKVLAQHALVCTGEDGHQKLSMPISDDTFKFVQIQAFERVMSTELGKKIAAQEALSTEEERSLAELTAQISDELLGTDTLKIVQELNLYEDFSWQTGQASRLIVEQANMNHIHSAACGHGSQIAQSPSFNAPSFAAFAPSYEADSHVDHNKLVVCENCPHQMVAHVHGNKGPVCPRCKKGPMKVAKKRKRS